MMPDANPFRHTRYETDDARLLVIDPHALAQFSDKNYYFSGSRGCGKTTCLRIADSEFRLDLPASISRRLPRDHDQLLGIYMNMSNKFIPALSKRAFPPSYRKILSTDSAIGLVAMDYMELILLRAMLSVVDRLFALGAVAYSEADERSLSAIISEKYRLTDAGRFDDLTNSIDERIHDITRVSHGVDPGRDIYHPKIESAFHSVVGDAFERIVGRCGFRRIRFLVDDAEVFKGPIGLALNTLVRIPQNKPISWSVAYVVGEFSNKDTLISSQSLSSEERLIVPLDRRDDTEAKFSEFAESIAELRLEHYIKMRLPHRLSDRLGSFDMNELAAASLRDAKGKEVRAFVARAKASALNDQAQRKHFPYYEQHLFDKGIISTINSSPATRKKNVASYLALCARYRLKPKYAGHNVIVSLSDGCIRDYLEIIGAIFETCLPDGQVQPPRSHMFVVENAPPISIVRQDDGIRLAANRKLNSITETIAVGSNHIEKLVWHLGEALRFLHMNDETTSPITNPERTLFTMALTGASDSIIASTWIREAIVEGLLREIQRSGQQEIIAFRLHRRFAAKFNYSYRINYDSPLRLTPYQIAQAVQGEAKGVHGWAAQAVKIWTKTSSQSDLPI